MGLARLGVYVPTTFGYINMEPLRQGCEVGLEPPGVNHSTMHLNQATMQQHQRLTGAMLFVLSLHYAELHVLAHHRFSRLPSASRPLRFLTSVFREVG